MAWFAAYEYLLGLLFATESLTEDEMLARLYAIRQVLNDDHFISDRRMRYFFKVIQFKIRYPHEIDLPPFYFQSHVN